jgi:NAD(P)-dependent dehydrogenase (short-subunit alcohol dehydrogenase family)
MDVSNQHSVRKAYEFVISKLPAGKGLWAIMNNAGISGPLGPTEWMNIDDYKKVLAVNTLGLIDVTMTFLPLIKKSRGRVVNTASVFGRHAIFGCPPYYVSKYGVEAFTDGLRRSLRPYHCKAILIEPGYHATPIVSKQNLEKHVEEAWSQATPEVKEEFGEEYFQKVRNEAHKKSCRVTSTRVSDVVDAYEHAILGLHPRARYVVGNDARYLWLPVQALPECLGDWILDNLDRDKPVPAYLKQNRPQ